MLFLDEARKTLIFCCLKWSDVDKIEKEKWDNDAKSKQHVRKRNWILNVWNKRRGGGEGVEYRLNTEKKVNIVFKSDGLFMKNFQKYVLKTIWFSVLHKKKNRGAWNFDFHSFFSATSLNRMACNVFRILFVILDFLFYLYNDRLA